MGQRIKVRCNGAGRHVNEVDLDAALGTDTVLRGEPERVPLENVPERVVLRCRECADGRVIVTREMIEDARRR